MQYQKVRFIDNYPVDFGYQIISDDGIFIKITDMDGNELTPPIFSCECVSPNPKPSWAT